MEAVSEFTGRSCIGIYGRKRNRNRWEEAESESMEAASEFLGPASDFIGSDRNRHHFLLYFAYGI